LALECIGDWLEDDPRHFVVKDSLRILHLEDSEADAVLVSHELERAGLHVSTQRVVTREELIAALNEDLAREFQAVIAYVVYSQVIKGAEYMNIAQELEKHAHEELAHALVIAKQIDYLGGTPTVTPKPVRTSDDAEEMLEFDLDNENQTVVNYRERVRQCEALGEYAMAEHIRDILMDEQEHQIDLASALGRDVPDLSRRAP